jgi:uncharacterized protein
VPASADELLAAGAHVVLDDLARVPRVVRGHLLGVRLADLDARLAQLGSVVVAFSGGADSAFLLAAAVRALGPYHVVAATAVSSSLPARSWTRPRPSPRSSASGTCTPGRTSWPSTATAATRATAATSARPSCSTSCARWPTSLAVLHVATGTNADDAVAGFRPGVRAAAERGAVTPLLDAG